MDEKYNVKYHCGCIHEITNNQGVHQPTGNNQECKHHKKSN